MAEDNPLASFRLALLPALALLLTAARGYETHPWRVVLQRSPDEAGREMSLAPGEAVTRSPAVQAPLATLREPVSLAIASIEQSLAAGTELVYVSVGGDAAERIDHPPEAYCAVPPNGAGVAVRAFFEVAAFGMLRPVNRSSPFSTHCLVDSDGDDRFDIAFLSGARREADLAPQPVGPLAATIARGRPIEGVAEGRIVYEPNRAGSKLRFFFETADAAGQRVQRELRSELGLRDLPRTITVQGAVIEVRSYDRARRAVQLRLVRPMAPGGYGFTPPPQVTYIPIYLPRR